MGRHSDLFHVLGVQDGPGEQGTYPECCTSKGHGAQNMGFRAANQETRGVSERRRDYLHTFCPVSQKGLGCRRLDQFIGSKATFIVAFLQDLYTAFLLLLPSLAGALLGSTMPFASCHLVFVLSTPHHRLTLASILLLSQHLCVLNTILTKSQFTQNKRMRGVEQGCGRA